MCMQCRSDNFMSGIDIPRSVSHGRVTEMTCNLTYMLYCPQKIQSSCKPTIGEILLLRVKLKDYLNSPTLSGSTESLE